MRNWKKNSQFWHTTCSLRITLGPEATPNHLLFQNISTSKIFFESSFLGSFRLLNLSKVFLCKLLRTQNSFTLHCTIRRNSFSFGFLEEFRFPISYELIMFQPQTHYDRSIFFIKLERMENRASQFNLYQTRYLVAVVFEHSFSIITLACYWKNRIDFQSDFKYLIYQSNFILSDLSISILQNKVSNFNHFTHNFCRKEETLISLLLLCHYVREIF